MSNSNLTVALRIRPLTKLEKKRAQHEVAFTVDKKMVVLVDEPSKSTEFLGQNRSKEKKFLYDVALGPDSTQVTKEHNNPYAAYIINDKSILTQAPVRQEVHEKTTLELIDNVINGYNVTVFAYGATGTGKTYTMVGTDQRPGIMARALNDLFRKVNKRRNTELFDIRMSYLEIYNEMMRDLLVPDGAYLELREDSRGVMHVAGLTETRAQSAKKVLALLMEGNRRRTQESTATNRTSSRSHAVLQVTVIQNDGADLNNKQKVGKMFLVDLAGSERASKTKNHGIRMKEGASINRSLLALGNVINALSKPMKAENKYVNYRDSKLTRLLKDSLGGNSRTVMIAHISPAPNQAEESKNTLVFANRAKNITTKITENTNEKIYHVGQYQNIIAELRREITRLNEKIVQNHAGDTPEKGVTMVRSRSAMASLNNDQDEDTMEIDGNTKVLTHFVEQPQPESRKQFTKYKENIIKLYQQQTELRHRMHDINDKAYAIAIGLSSKTALLDAWQHKQRNLTEEERLDEPEPIKRLRYDVMILEEHLEDLDNEKETLEDNLERAMKEEKDMMQSIAQITTTENEKEIVTALCNLNKTELVRDSLQSDAVLQMRRLEKYEVSMHKIRKYGDVCDQLISSQLTLIQGSDLDIPSDTKTLFNEYKTIKNQAHYHMLPLNEKASQIGQKSWNRQILEKHSHSKNTGFSKTLNYSELQQLKQGHEHSVKLPPIESGSKDDSDMNSKSPSSKQIIIESTSDSRAKPGDNSMPNTPLLPRENLNSRASLSSGQSSTNSLKVSQNGDKKKKRRTSHVVKNPPNRRLKSPNRSHLPIIHHK